MSNIQTFLDKIKSARYGKDVRQAIHDAIQEVDKVADTAQGSATKMAEQASNHETVARQCMESALESAENALRSAEQSAASVPMEYVQLIGIIDEHKGNAENPHEVTKSQIGLGNVENKSSSAIRDEITASNVTKALGYTPAELDSTGKVPSSQLPSYVDDTIEGTLSTFPSAGETGKIYVDTSTNKTYRWSGSKYVEISASLALGETSSTAYRGDRGKAAYEHSQKTSGNPHGVTKSDVGLGNVPNVATNDQAPTYSESSSLAKLASGEKLSVAFGKIAKAISSLITHLADSVAHITSTERTKWNGYGTTISEINSNLSEIVGVSNNQVFISNEDIETCVVDFHHKKNFTTTDWDYRLHADGNNFVFYNNNKDGICLNYFITPLTGNIGDGCTWYRMGKLIIINGYYYIANELAENTTIFNLPYAPKNRLGSPFVKFDGTARAVYCEAGTTELKVANWSVPSGYYYFNISYIWNGTDFLEE